ncbi:hypothetical protein SH661x_000390 [Planctomicrobium sp. SH661]|uniref:hypothetical protein n=1 Tax=Planctomicrobium sp. SH661 TaxID=3448124 RepID=UPI003F5C3F02
MSKDLKLANLADYDGGSVQVMFDQALRRILNDLDDRPALKKARKLTLEMTFEPRCSDRDLDTIVAKVRIKDNIPNKEARECVLVPAMQRGFIQFDPSSAITRTAPGQNEFDFAGEEEAE